MLGFPGSGPPGPFADAERASAWVISRNPIRSSKSCAVKKALLRFGGEVSLGFFCQDAEHVDALTRAHQIDLGLLSFVSGSAKLDDGRHVDGLDERLEVHRGRMVHAGVGGPNGGVEAICCRLVGAREPARSARQ